MESQGNQMNLHNVEKEQTECDKPAATKIRETKCDTPAATKIEKQKGLERAMYTVTSNKMDIAEVYGPERVTRVAEQYGFKPGWSLDFTTTDEHGRPWNFDCLYMRNKVVRRLLEDKLMLVIGSPMCTEICHG